MRLEINRILADDMNLRMGTYLAPSSSQKLSHTPTRYGNPLTRRPQNPHQENPRNTKPMLPLIKHYTNGDQERLNNMGSKWGKKPHI